MASYDITDVRVEQGPGGHEHISAVALSGNTAIPISRATVIRDLRDPNGDRYYTYGGGEYADVIVKGCPYCAFSDYITTTPDNTTANNLLKLPRF